MQRDNLRGGRKNKPNKNADFSLPFRFSLCTLFLLPLPLSAFLHIVRICFYYSYNLVLFQAFHLFPLICNFYIKLWGIRPHSKDLNKGLFHFHIKFFLSLISGRKIRTNIKAQTPKPFRVDVCPIGKNTRTKIKIVSNKKRLSKTVKIREKGRGKRKRVQRENH